MKKMLLLFLIPFLLQSQNTIWSDKGNIKFTVSSKGVIGYDEFNRVGKFYKMSDSTFVSYMFATSLGVIATKSINGKDSTIIKYGYDTQDGKVHFYPKKSESQDYNHAHSRSFSEIDGSNLDNQEMNNWPIWNFCDNNIDFDFTSSELVENPELRNKNDYLSPSYLSDEEIFVRYTEYNPDNETLADDELGIEFLTRVNTFSEGDLKDVIISTNYIKNISNQDLKDVYLTLITDPDIKLTPQLTQDKKHYNNTKLLDSANGLKACLVYNYRAEDSSYNKDMKPNYLAITVLETPQVDEDGNLNNQEINLDLQIEPIYTAFDSRGGTLREVLPERYKSKIDSATLQPEDQDLRVLVNAGPFNLKAGEEVRFSYAFVLSEPLQDFDTGGEWIDVSGLETPASYDLPPYSGAAEGSLMSKIEKTWNLYYDGKINTELCEKTRFVNPDDMEFEIKYIYNINGELINTTNISNLYEGLYFVIKSNGFEAKSEKIIIIN